MLAAHAPVAQVLVGWFIRWDKVRARPTLASAERQAHPMRCTGCHKIRKHKAKISREGGGSSPNPIHPPPRESGDTHVVKIITETIFVHMHVVIITSQNTNVTIIVSDMFVSSIQCGSANWCNAGERCLNEFCVCVNL